MSDTPETTPRGLKTDEDIEWAANRIYDRGWYFPGDRPATREQVVAEIARSLRDARDNKPQPIDVRELDNE